jgi:hypothetical protein
VGKARALHFGFRIARGADPIVELQQLDREREQLEKSFGWHFAVDIEGRAMRGSEPRARKRKKSLKVLKKVTKKSAPKTIRKKLKKLSVKKKTTAKKSTQKKSTNKKKTTQRKFTKKKAQKKK